MAQVYRVNRTYVRSRNHVSRFTKHAGHGTWSVLRGTTSGFALCADPDVQSPSGFRAFCVRARSKHPSVVLERGIHSPILSIGSCAVLCLPPGQSWKSRMTVVEMAAAFGPKWRVKYEGSSFDEEDVREVSHHPSSRPGVGVLLKPPTQATAGLTHGTYRRCRPPS